LAAGGAGAAVPKVADHWILRRAHAFRLETLRSRVCAAVNELGWIEGRTAAIEYRWAEGRTERFTEIANEFARLKVDVIVTSGTAVGAVKQVTSVIPIVFAVAADPLGGGLVANLARPGGNVTGLISPVSASKLCATLSPVFAGWRSWAMSAIPPPCRSWMRFKRQPAR
jgi:ABC-type uncharacterized transport system substrate-binding protein